MMNIMNKSDAITAAFQNPAFQKEAKGLNTLEDFRNLMETYGVSLTAEEAAEVCAQIAKASEVGEDGELGEGALEGVSGGVWGWVALGVVCVGAFALGIYNGYNED